MGALRRYSATGMTRETIETNNKDGRCSCEAARALKADGKSNGQWYPACKAMKSKDSSGKGKMRKA